MNATELDAVDDILHRMSALRDGFVIRDANKLACATDAIMDQLLQLARTKTTMDLWERGE